MEFHNENSRMTRRSLLGRMAAGAVTIAGMGSGLGLLTPRRASAKTSPWNDQMEFAVTFEINQAEGGRWRRPYVAVWVEDDNGNPVRTLSLYIQADGRGPRWLNNLRRWCRGEEMREQAEGGNLVETVSSATRPAGKYTVVWNGRRDNGKVASQGHYFVCIEAAREHGTYQIMRQGFTLADKSFNYDLDGNVEIKGAHFEYRKRK